MTIATKIEWARSTFNPWWGCVKVSPGCTNCYAEAFDRRTFGTAPHVTAKGEEREPHWGKDAPRRFFGEKHWAEPLAWNREAAKTGEPWRVFCASMADVFEDRRDLDPWRRKLWTLIELTPALTWLLLTKRPENITRLWPEGFYPPGPQHWPNVWLGTTVEDRARLSRMDNLREIPAAVRWLSIEPLIEDLGLVNFAGFAWAVIGGESGHGARPYNLAWPRSLIGQMRGQGVAPFHKQVGRHPYQPDGVGDLWWTLRDPKGGDMEEWPEDLRVREFPA